MDRAEARKYTWAREARDFFFTPKLLTLDAKRPTYGVQTNKTADLAGQRRIGMIFFYPEK